MSGLHLNIDYIANNIQQYIDDENFFDMLDEDIIFQVLEKTTLDPQNFKALLSQGQSKLSSSNLYNCAHKCNVIVNTFEDAINVLKCYKNIFNLESSHGLIKFLKKYNAEHVSQLDEIQNLKNKVEILEKDKTSLNNKNDQLIESISYFAKLSQLKDVNDFNKVYNYLKELSEKGDEIKMFHSCSIGLSEVKNSYDGTPLIDACINGDLKLAKSLIEGGCNRNAINKYSNNCLLEASAKGQLEVVKYLIDNGFDKDWRKKTNGFNAILMASQFGKLETVKYLQSIGCDVNSKSNLNANCIYFASLKGHLETVKYLVSVGGNPKEKANNGFSPLIVAAQEGYLEVVKYLIQIGCDKNDKTNYNDTSLHWATIKGQFEVVQYLVSIGVNLNHQNNFGKTALSYAIEKQNENDNYKKILDLLSRSGAI
ncbi:hypothetical protein TVAG_490010 [Trichomonas vaginalis G3]|uniref:Uncharacterized protein n=1 Tax=Trichomonas vaginalis (strain ATCC PRA-98 / G3) TaxID=412133 RepID=A2FB38_TRIV3|nr:protein ubiquitination [Trichomonas vaginalis G3]EAX97873.1 hypothetical protein TVAG_490010 [Trichomonas vaginalis G3]KAI5501153.1 protein ubiquitination [Trichomonas vaginalis G3]|eukprot:XP_001310803.1 hypothetical protein [Trichomonas vaginalis G3]